MPSRPRSDCELLLTVLGALVLPQAVPAQTPEVLDPELAVRVAASGLSQPTGMAFIGENDILVNQKANGQVRRIVDGVLQPDPVLDLAVNSQSERGLLGMALDKRFHVNGHVYLYWTESSTGADTNVNAEVPLLGNRVDRFVWNGSTLQFDQNLIRLRAAQPAVPAVPGPAQNAAGNHNGGVIKVSPDDGKIYIFIGDNGRRGWTQNLRCGPATFYDCPPNSPLVDDVFGGPMPDDAHLTGVVLRLNPDGSAPRWNPFFRFGEEVGGEVGENIQKIYAYGFRNGYGMAFDPVGHRLWEAANGDDTFSELELVEPGLNSGWIQFMGPASRVAQFKAIETDPTAPQPFAAGGYFGLQQARWLPTNIADPTAEAMSRLQMFPGAHYSDPELSWLFEVGPAAIGFLDGKGLGNEYKNDLFMGGSRNFLEGGHLFRIELAPSRKAVRVSDPRLEDLVADNPNKWSLVESESLLFGRNFGIVTEILTGPNGNLFLLSNQAGAIYEIHRP
jgi:aldose sugar dehydrogenase